MTIHHLLQFAKRFDMVIVSPILERDEVQGDVLWNTAGLAPSSSVQIVFLTTIHIILLFQL